jgi:hypothetical protein
MQHPRPAAPESDKNWLYTVYAAVLLKLLEDLERTRTQYQLQAIQWFAAEPYEVAIVCAICRLTPTQVYLEVSRRLRAKKIRCPQITFIRWHLRHGDALWEIRLPTEQIEEQAKAA